MLHSQLSAPTGLSFGRILQRPVNISLESAPPIRCLFTQRRRPSGYEIMRCAPSEPIFRQANAASSAWPIQLGPRLEGARADVFDEAIQGQQHTKQRNPHAVSCPQFEITVWGLCPPVFPTLGDRPDRPDSSYHEL
ncbi:hypothetical protein CFIO01_01817 [Colletotrichum fioriniae PJ7]|uniref:Uncharacterized protein n=1 Tax=Colletotrichum fioriniae PJ7 TaxID=1445577 RepID=A0A010QQI3_9PEZI|nr:hypothetical protein CFIO01_01817 [Colletotrichum fioriniae PJ7]